MACIHPLGLAAGLGLLGILAAACGGQALGAAELVLRNGRILTVDPARPEAAALAVRGGRIAAVGDAAAVEKLIGPETSVIDLQGSLAVPGLIESHAHLLEIGLSRTKLDLTGTGSEEEIAAMVQRRAAALTAGQWIEGRGWDQNDWPKTAFPTHASLTAAAPRNPVCLSRVDGHAIWVNQAALSLAGLTRETPDPSGGRILRDESGNPTGVLVDNAEGLATALIPPPDRAAKKAALLDAIQHLNSLGFTSFHDAGAGAETIALYRELLREGKLTLRLNVMLDGSDEPLLDQYLSAGPVAGEGDHFLAIRSIKLYADGALGSRGAALLEDYSDEPGNRGLIVDSEERILALAERALDRGFQVCTHAIGDRGNRVALDAYERAFKSSGRDGRQARFRIEHAQILDEADIPRFGRLGVIAAMQAQHCTSDMPWVPDRIGEDRAAEGAYVWRKLLDQGACLCNGSDAPVESANPLWGLYAAVTRCDRRGNPPGGWHPEQCMTRQEALESFTVAGAFAAFEEEIKGTLAKGKLADITVLSQDIMTVAPAAILETEVLMTIVGGRVVYRRDASPVKR